MGWVRGTLRSRKRGVQAVRRLDNRQPVSCDEADHVQDKDQKVHLESSRIFAKRIEEVSCMRGLRFVRVRTTRIINLSFSVYFLRRSFLSRSRLPALAISAVSYLLLEALFTFIWHLSTSRSWLLPETQVLRSTADTKPPFHK